MQAYLKIDSPCAGGVFAPTARERYGIFQFEDFRRVGVDVCPEAGAHVFVALTLGRVVAAA